MNKTEFIREVAAGAEVTQNVTRKVADSMFDVIVNHLKDEDGVSPFSGVKLYAVYKDERQARNPRTGETITTEAKYQPKVKFTKSFKDAIN